MNFVVRLLANAAALYVATQIVPGVTFEGTWLTFFGVALVFGVVNAFVRPIIELVSAPITCLTLGLFHFVISAVMLLLVAAIPFLGFQVSGIIAAFLGAIVMAIVGLVLSWILPD